MVTRDRIRKIIGAIRAHPRITGKLGSHPAELGRIYRRRL